MQHPSHGRFAINVNQEINNFILLATRTRTRLIIIYIKNTMYYNVFRCTEGRKMTVHTIRISDDLEKLLEESKTIMEKNNPGMTIYYSDVIKNAIAHYWVHLTLLQKNEQKN